MSQPDALELAELDDPEPGELDGDGATYHGSLRARDLANAAGWATRAGTRPAGRRRPGGNTRPPGR